MLKQFLFRYSRRFEIPAQCPDPAFRPFPPGMRLAQVLCFKHKRRVARDNTVKLRRHTLQLLSGGQRHSYADATVPVPHSLDGRLWLQHEGRVIAVKTAPASPAYLGNGISPSADDAIIYLQPENGAKSREGEPDPLAMVAAENDLRSVIDEEDVTFIRVTATPNRPTFLQLARRDAIQKSEQRGLYIRRMARELGIHQDTVWNYINAESPPTRRSPTTSQAPTSDAIAE